MTTGVILLAAGRGRRFGSDKRLAQLPDGQLLIMAAIQRIRSSGLPLVVCLGGDDHTIEKILAAEGVHCIKCPDARHGMGATLANGIAAIEGCWRGALVALADMPLIRPQTYSCVSDKLAADRIVVPVYANRRGHPVGFGRDYFPELLALRGDRGARAVLLEHPEDLIAIDVDDPAVVADVDTPRDLDELP